MSEAIAITKADFLVAEEATGDPVGFLAQFVADRVDAWATSNIIAYAALHEIRLVRMPKEDEC
jgi:hypothetical protein